MSQTRQEAYSYSYYYKWLSAIAIASSAETGGLYPIDTITRRVQNNPTPIYSRALPFATNMTNLQQVIFADAATQGILARGSALYRGLPIALGYKFLQRGALALQAPLKSRMEDYWQKQSLWMDVGSGAAIGTGEACILLPLDFYKTRLQTRQAPEASLSGGMNPYTGFFAAWGRNVTFVTVMSIATSQSQRFMVQRGFFGTPAHPQAKPNEKQKHASRALGFGLGTFASSPFDVVKIRMQAQRKKQEEAAAQAASVQLAQKIRPEKAATKIASTLIVQEAKQAPGVTRSSPIQVAKEIYVKEGPSAFFKGITLKAAAQSFRLTFFFGVADAVLKRVLPEEAPTAKAQGPKPSG